MNISRVPVSRTALTSAFQTGLRLRRADTTPLGVFIPRTVPGMHGKDIIVPGGLTFLPGPGIPQLEVFALAAARLAGYMGQNFTSADLPPNVYVIA